MNYNQINVRLSGARKLEKISLVFVFLAMLLVLTGVVFDSDALLILGCVLCLFSILSGFGSRLDILGIRCPRCNDKIGSFLILPDSVSPFKLSRIRDPFPFKRCPKCDSNIQDDTE